MVNAHLHDGLERPLEDPRVGGAGVDGADLVEQPLAADALDLLPQLVGALEQHDVGGVLVVGQADDARVAVRRTLVVRDVELLDAQHALPALGQLVAGGAAHPAHADDDGVIVSRIRVHWKTPNGTRMTRIGQIHTDFSSIRANPPNPRHPRSISSFSLPSSRSRSTRGWRFRPGCGRHCRAGGCRPGRRRAC